MEVEVEQTLSVAESNEQAVLDNPMDYDDVLPGMWVVVVYEKEKFIGNVQHKQNGVNNARGLDKPFGIWEPQSYETNEAIYVSNRHCTNYNKGWEKVVV